MNFEPVEEIKGTLINRPDLWVVGTEYDFGSGLYGQRVITSVTAAADVQVTALLINQNIKILSYGGRFNIGETDNDFPVPYVSDNGDWAASIWSVNGQGCRFVSKVNRTRTNALVDVWLLYKKN